MAYEKPGTPVLETPPSGGLGLSLPPPPPPAPVINPIDRELLPVLMRFIGETKNAPLTPDMFNAFVEKEKELAKHNGTDPAKIEADLRKAYEAGKAAHEANHEPGPYRPTAGEFLNVIPKENASDFVPPAHTPAHPGHSDPKLKR